MVKVSGYIRNTVNNTSVALQDNQIITNNLISKFNDPMELNLEVFNDSNISNKITIWIDILVDNYNYTRVYQQFYQTINANQTLNINKTFTFNVLQQGAVYIQIYVFNHTTSMRDALIRIPIQTQSAAQVSLNRFQVVNYRNNTMSQNDMYGNFNNLRLKNGDRCYANIAFAVGPGYDDVRVTLMLFNTTTQAFSVLVDIVVTHITSLYSNTYYFYVNNVYNYNAIKLILKGSNNTVERYVGYTVEQPTPTQPQQPPSQPQQPPSTPYQPPTQPPTKTPKIKIGDK